MSSPLPDQDLHLVLLAWRLGLIGREDFAQAITAWGAEPSRPIAEVLAQGGALSAHKRDVLHRSARDHLALHDWSPPLAVAALLRADPLGPELVPVPTGPHGAALRDRLATIAARHHGHLSTVRHDPKPAADAPATNGAAGAAGTPSSPAADGEGAGRYRVLRPLARGGLGEVFVARDEQLHREVALKEIQARHAHDGSSQGRFLLEAEITGALEHPGIVPIYSLGRHADGRPYYAMRLIHGDTFQEAIRRFHDSVRAGGATRRRQDLHLEMRHLLGSLIDACNTVEYAHSRGVIHRDIKPSNIMLGKFGETLIMDWGLAKSVGDADRPASGRSAESSVRESLVLHPRSAVNIAGLTPTLTGATMGTPAYMSPEQAAGQVDMAGPASDVYGLGATLYELLTGRPPFREDDIAKLLPKVAVGEFPPPRRIIPKIPAALEAICLRAMALKPEDRYQSPRALADDLEAWMAGEPVAAYRESGLSALFNRFRRKATHPLSAARLLKQAKQRETAERHRAEELHREANRLAIQAALERGLSHCEQGDVAAGLLWMARGLDLCSGAGEPLLDSALRSNLSAWMDVLPRCEHELPHEDWVNAVAFSPDGRSVLTGGADGIARLWDVETGRPIAPDLIHPDRVVAVAIHPIEAVAVTACVDHLVRLWDLATGEPLGDPLDHPQRVQRVAFHPSGEWLATACVDGRARLWAWRPGTRLDLAEVRHRDWINDLCFRKDGGAFLTGSGDRTAQVWAVPGEPAPTIPPLEHNDYVHAVAFSGDGEWIATGGQDRGVRLWSARTGQPAGGPWWHADSVHALALDQAGRLLISASRDTSVIVWDTTAAAPACPPISHPDWVKALDLSPDGTRIVTGCTDRRARIWAIPSGVRTGLRVIHGGWVNAVAFSPNGRSFITGCGDGAVRWWDAESGEPLGRPLEHPDRVYALAFHPEGKLVATGCKDGLVRIWDLATGLIAAAPIACLDRINAVAFRRDGQVLAIASDDGTARLWQVETEQPLGEPIGHPNRVNDVAFLADGHAIATAGLDGLLRVWESETGRQVRAIDAGQGLLQALAARPDGQVVATCGKDRFVRLWDLATGQSVGSPLPHHDRVLGLAFSPDGTRLATSGRDQLARLWDLATGKPIGPPWHHADWVNAVDVRADGGAVLTGGTDGTARLWPVVPPRPASADSTPTLTHLERITGRTLTADGTIATRESSRH